MDLEMTNGRSVKHRGSSRFRRGVTVLLSLLLAGMAYGERTAGATTELNAQYDARSVGMGGTGVAFISNGASLYLNPATLDGIQKGAFTANVMPVFYELRGPFAPNTTVSSGYTFAPYFLFGGGLRVAERLVIGIAAFPTVGIGTEFEKVPALGGNNAKVQVASMEAAPGVSYAILDRLSVGVTYRITYTTSQTVLPVMVGDQLAMVNQETKGVNFLGLSAGLWYRPTDQLSLGFNYRSRTSTALSGTQNVTGLAEQDIDQQYATPHSFRIGSALRLIDNRLLLALDGKVVLYQGSNKELVTEVTNAPAGTPASATRTVTPQNWNNVVGGNLGGEFAVTPAFLVRAGVALTTSATPTAHALPFLAPPSPIATYHLGAGMHLEHLDVDLGGFFSSSSSDVSNAQYPANPSPTPGRYEFTIISAGLSATYRL